MGSVASQMSVASFGATPVSSVRVAWLSSSWHEPLLAWMRRADCLLVDGTLWRDDEMRLCEVGDKLGSEMGHLPQSGPGGMIELLDAMPAQRKILIHINNTNPILDIDSPERAELSAHGIDVAWDGMSINL